METHLREEASIKQQIFSRILRQGELTEGEIIQGVRSSKPTVLKYIRALIEEKRVTTKVGIREITQHRVLRNTLPSGEGVKRLERKSSYKRQVTVYYVPKAVSLRYQVINTLPEQLEDLSIPKSEIRKAHRQSAQRIRQLFPSRFRFSQEVRLAVSRKEKEKLTFFAEVHDMDKARTIGNSTRIILAYPPNDPVKLPKRSKDIFLKASLDIINSTFYRGDIDGLIFRKTPLRIIIEYHPNKHSQDLKEIQLYLFPHYMRKFHPKVLQNFEDFKLTTIDPDIAVEKTSFETWRVSSGGKSYEEYLKEVVEKTENRWMESETLRRYYLEFQDDFQKYYYK